MKGFVECTYKGRVYSHTINFELKSCTCRWFLAFAVCAHLVAACDLYNYELKGYKKPRVFVYRNKRGRKPKALTFTDMAFRSKPMPIIAIPVGVDDLRQNLFLISTENLIPLPTLSIEPEPIVVPKQIVAPEPIVTPEPVVVPIEPEVRCTRSYTKNSTKRLQTRVVPVVVPKRKRGRPPKNAPALSVD